MEAWQLEQGPFGYTPRSVRLVLADRDRSLVEAWERAKAAEAQSRLAVRGRDVEGTARRTGRAVPSAGAAEE